MKHKRNVLLFTLTKNLRNVPLFTSHNYWQVIWGQFLFHLNIYKAAEEYSSFHFTILGKSSEWRFLFHFNSNIYKAVKECFSFHLNCNLTSLLKTFFFLQRNPHCTQRMFLFTIFEGKPPNWNLINTFMSIGQK